MGQLYKAEKRAEHFAAVVGPLYNAGVPFNDRRVPRIAAVTFQNSQSVAKSVNGNSYANIVVGSTCIGIPGAGTFVPEEGNEREVAEKRPVCFHGNYGTYYPPKGPPIRAAINCGLTSGEGVDCLGDIEPLLDKILARMQNELKDKTQFLKDMGGGFVDGVKEVGGELKGMAESAAKKAQAAASKSVFDWMSDAADAVGGAYESTKAAIKSGKEMYDTLSSMTPEQIMQAVMDFMMDMLFELACHLSDFLKELAEGKEPLGKQLGKMMGSAAATAALGAASGGVLAGASKMASVGKVLSKLGNPLEKLKQAAKRAKDGVARSIAKLKEAAKNAKRKLDNVVAVVKCPPCIKQVLTGKPVNPVLGAKVLADERTRDFTVQGLLPLAWQRTYVSQNPHVGILGQGWRLPVELELWLGKERIELLEDTGRLVPYSRLRPGQQQFQPTTQTTLSAITPAHFHLQTLDGLRLHFAPYNMLLAEKDGEIVAPPPAIAYSPDQLSGEAPSPERRLVLQIVEDRNGNRLWVDWHPVHALPTAVRSATRHYKLLYLNTAAGNRLAAVDELLADDKTLRHVRYHADPVSGDLRQVDGIDATWVHRYDYQNHLLTRYTQADGVWFDYRYSQLNPRGKVEHFHSSTGEALTFVYETGQTRVRDQQGEETIYHFSGQAPHAHWTGITHPGGSKDSFTLDADGHIIATTDAMGRTTSQVHNSRGQITLVEDPSGASTLIRYHSENHQPVEIVDALGNSTHYDYDARGNQTFSQDPAGGITRTHYNAQGLPELIIDPKGGSKTLDWDKEGNLLAYTDCSGYCSRWQYDSQGRMTATQDAAGNLTRYQFDLKSQLTRITHPDGATEKFTYNALGLLVAYQDPAQRITQYEYRADGRPSARIEADGSRVSYHYDARGQLTSLVNANGQRYALAYNAQGDLVSETGWDKKTTRYQYNAASELIKKIEHDGRSTHYQRDARGLLLEQISQAAGTDTGSKTARVRYTHDALGRLIHARNSHSHVAFTYGVRGELNSETTVHAGQSLTLNHAYDVMGNRTATVTPHGRKINYLYYGPGHLHQINIDGEAIADYERDKLHREISRRQGKLETLSDYDPQGRLARQQWRFHTANADRNPQPLRQYQYNSAGDLINREDRLRKGSTRYTYDPLSRLIRAQHPDLDEIFAFDPAHNLIDAPASELLERTQTQKRNLSADLVKRWLTEQAMNDPRWDFLRPMPEAQDWLQQHIAARQAQNGVPGRYADNRVRIVGDTLYCHDARGRVTLKRSPTQQTRLIWDEQDQLAAADTLEILPQERFTPPASARAKGSKGSAPDMADPWGTPDRDPHGLPQPRWVGVKRSYAQYSYDPLGRRLGKQVQTVNGWVQESSWNADMQQVLQMQPPQSIATDPAWLDPSNNLIEQDPATAARIAAQMAPTPDTTHTETIQYLWNGNQLLAEYHNPGPNQLKVIHHISEVDSFVPVAQVIDEYRQGAPDLAPPFKDRASLQGLDPNPPLRSDNPDKDWLTQLRKDAPKSPLGNPLPLDHRWVKTARAEELNLQEEVWEKLDAQETRLERKTRIYHVHTDHLGTPQEMTSDDARLVWMIWLSAWGKTRGIRMPEATEEEKTTLEQNFRFQGQYYDKESGLHYNRFRYYDAHAARFVSQDPIGLDGGDNVYSYAPNSTGWIDPLGLQIRPGGAQTHDTGMHGELSPGKNRATGHTNTKDDKYVQSHHPVQDEWAKQNLCSCGYDSNMAPAVLLKSASKESHAKISAAQRKHRSSLDALKGGRWGSTTVREEFNIGYRQMTDAGVPKNVARSAIKKSYKYFDCLGAFKK